MFLFIFLLVWFVASVSLRELLRNQGYPSFWKKALAYIITAPSLLGEFLIWNRLGGAIGMRLGQLAAWLTR